jgi:hypothetical protein
MNSYGGKEVPNVSTINKLETQVSTWYKIQSKNSLKSQKQELTSLFKAIAG